MERLPHYSPWERLQSEIRSRRNGLFLALRNAVAFHRAGYAETGDTSALVSPAAASLENRYGLRSRKLQLTKEVYAKNLATLFVMEKMLGEARFPAGNLRILEPGCQDFARLPGFKAFFRRLGHECTVTGLEVDAFPLLHNFHSRADKARYYASLEGKEDLFHAADFFTYEAEAVPLVISFYPFVSPDPALAWGLPKNFGRPELWVRAFVRNLASGGYLLVVHQGEWEEEEFDDARVGTPLELLRREVVDCPFYPLPHAACASLYRRQTSTP